MVKSTFGSENVKKTEYGQNTSVLDHFSVKSSQLLLLLLLLLFQLLLVLLDHMNIWRGGTIDG